MIDVKLILDDPKGIASKLAKKGCIVDFDPLIKLQDKRKSLLLSVEQAKAERNKLSASVPQVKKEGGDVNAIFAKVKEISAKSALDEQELTKVSLYKDGSTVKVSPIKGLFKKENVIDVAFLSVHGTNVEDGTLAGFIQMLDLPFTSCDVLGGSVGQDKAVMKAIFKAEDIPIQKP